MGECPTLYAARHHNRSRRGISRDLLLDLGRMHDAGPPGCGLVGRTVGTKGRARTARRIHLSHRRQSRRAGGRCSKLHSRRGAAASAEVDGRQEAFWAEFHAGVKARFSSQEADLLLRFVEVPGENLYFSRKGPPF
jgi:hypothetical protein